MTSISLGVSERYPLWLHSYLGEPGMNVTTNLEKFDLTKEVITQESQDSMRYLAQWKAPRWQMNNRNNSLAPQNKFYYLKNLVYCNPSVTSVSYLRTSLYFLYPWAATLIHPTVFTTDQSLGINRKIWELNPAEAHALINAKSPLCNLKSSLLEILKVPSLGTLWVTGKLWHNMFLISQKVLVQQPFGNSAGLLNESERYACSCPPVMWALWPELLASAWSSLIYSWAPPFCSPLGHKLCCL